MYQASTLKEIRYLYKLYGKVNVMEIEEPQKHFTGLGILDVFDRCLNSREANTLMLPFPQHNLKYEDRFINFIQDVFHYHLEEHVYVLLNRFNPLGVNRVLDDLEKPEKAMFLNLLVFDKCILKVTDIKTLSFLMKLNTREHLFSKMYFTKTKSVIIGNFDLSFPLYCKEACTLKEYEKLARKNNLYIREW
ncbi:hypothetical protein EEL31_04680 [Brevibacillus laterosporus]|nr:hypothetical protein [Brevibacillus laterosporus]TPG67927.1 hypothetical protein EEL31_04680 [Brevibacillus laterosporus]